MATLREEACYFSQAVRLGVVQPAEAIAWADSRVLGMSDYPDELAEVSLSEGCTRPEFAERLAGIPGEGDPAQGDRLLFAHLHRSLLERRMTLEEVADAVQSWAASFWLSVEERTLLLSEAEDHDGDLPQALSRYAHLAAEIPNLAA